MNEWVIDASDRDFESAVIERSQQTPIVVDFWAPWCGPCHTLGPLLERLAEEHHGAFILAKVNVDESPELSRALNIQSIPMVLGFRDGKGVAEFVGALPEAAVRQFLATVLPSEAERLAVEAAELWSAGSHAESEATFQRALELDARCDRALFGLAGILADRDAYDTALQLLDRISAGPLRQDADRLAAEIRIRLAGGGDENSLRVKLAANPADLETRLLLGQVLAALSKYEEALTEDLEIVRRNRGFRDGAARKAMLDIFDLLGADSAITNHYRSELAKVLFS
jgi:putative thioredoxin